MALEAVFLRVGWPPEGPVPGSSTIGCESSGRVEAGCESSSHREVSSDIIGGSASNVVVTSRGYSLTMGRVVL